jgi:hypothetical protein
MPLRYTEQFTEGVEYEAGLPADSYAIGVHNTPWVDMNSYHRGVGELSVGEMQAGATLDCVLQESTTAAGANIQAVGAKGGGNKAITQLTQAGGDGGDRVVIEFQSEEITMGHRWVRLQLTVAGAAVELDAQVKRFQAAHSPVSIAALTEVVD